MFAFVHCRTRLSFIGFRFYLVSKVSRRSSWILPINLSNLSVFSGKKQNFIFLWLFTDDVKKEEEEEKSLIDSFRNGKEPNVLATIEWNCFLMWRNCGWHYLAHFSVACLSRSVLFCFVSFFFGLGLLFLFLLLFVGIIECCIIPKLTTRKQCVRSSYHTNSHTHIAVNNQSGQHSEGCATKVKIQGGTKKK